MEGREYQWLGEEAEERDQLKMLEPEQAGCQMQGIRTQEKSIRPQRNK